MGKLFVKDLREGDYVKSTFMVSDRSLVNFRDRNGSFLNITFVDKTGEIPAVAWENSTEFFKITTPGDVVGVGGVIKVYRSNLQIVVDELWTCNKDEYQIEDFLPCTTADVEELKEFLLDTISQIKDGCLRGILEYFFSDESWVERFMKAPAAKRMHHDYIGGLAEHTVNVVKLSESVCKLYPNINTDLLLTGAILHDMGKVDEYIYDCRIDLSDEGRLLGHIAIGQAKIDDAIKSFKFFPKELGVALKHMILSHHGEYEWGSPKRPKFLEACILHHVDNLDAQANKFSKIIEEDNDDFDQWTSYDQALGRSLYVGVHRMGLYLENESEDESAASKDSTKRGKTLLEF